MNMEKLHSLRSMRTSVSTEKHLQSKPVGFCMLNANHANCWRIQRRGRADNCTINARRTVIFLNLVIYLGFLPNLAKSQLAMTQIFYFLGESYDVVEARVYPTQKRLYKIQEQKEWFLNSESHTAH